MASQTANTQSAYTANVTAQFVLDGSATTIKPEYIKYIIIEDMYSDRYMPIIYMSISVADQLYNDIIKNEKSGKIYLNIQKSNNFSTLALAHDDIKDQFTYVVSTSNPNYNESLVADKTKLINSYKVVTLALMSMKLANAAKTSFNGIFGKIDQSTLIMKIMTNTTGKLIIKKPQYNPTYDTIVIPPLNSRESLIKYLYQKCPFYDTKYVFFMDFNRSYLIDLAGKAIDGADGQLQNVHINIDSAAASNSYTPGIATSGDAYVLNINPANTNVSLNKGTDKVANQLVFVQDDGDVKSVNLNVNNAVDSTTKQAFKRGGNATLYKNIAESNTIVTEVVKENIDGSIFTPNKGYYVKNQSKYSNYDGNYTLLYKKEVIKNVEGTFGLSVCLGLKKVGNITSLGSSVVSTAESASTSATTKVTTTTAKAGSSKRITTSATRSAAPYLPKVKKVKAKSDNDNLLITPETYNIDL